MENEPCRNPGDPRLDRLPRTADVRYACEHDGSGYAVAAVRCIDALRTVGVDVAWEPMINVSGRRGRAREALYDLSQFGAPSSLVELQRSATPGEVLIVHTIPASIWSTARAELKPAIMIGHVVWEAEAIPGAWRADLLAADSLWVPTEWNAWTFREAGLDRPVHVVPHVTAPFLDDPVAAAAPIEIPLEHTVFLMVSAWDWRKRPDRTIDAFLTAFDRDDPVTLVVKTNEHIAAWSHDAWQEPGVVKEVWRQVMDVVKEHRRPANVVLDTGQWTDAEMGWMLHRADCYVSLTSSEGWGLGAFDAACVGTPVLITGYGGHVEWLGAGYPGLLPFTMVPVQSTNGTSFESGMQWAEPDLAASVDAMRAVHSRRFSALTEAARTLEPLLRERYSPAAVGVIASELLP